MLTILDNEDILFHYRQLRAAGFIPDIVKLDGVTFERGGSILVDGSIDPPILGAFDVKLSVVIKLLSDTKTIRLRVKDLEVSGIGTRAIVMKVLERIVNNLTVPGLRWVKDGADGYVEYKRPQEWVLMKDLQTADNRLSLVLQGFDIPAAMKEFQVAEKDRMEHSHSLADQVLISNAENGAAHVSPGATG